MKTIKTLSLLVALIITTAFTSCIYLNSNGIKGNKNIKKERREVKDFTKIEVSGSFKIMLEQGEENTLTLKTDENLLPYIKTKTEGKKLIIESKKDLDPSKENIVYLTFKNLDEIEISGACAIEGQNAMTFHKLSVDVSGAAEIDLELTADELDFDLSGASSMNLSGRADKLDMDVSGAGKIKAKKLVVQHADIELSGAAFAQIHVEQTLAVEISGAGGLTYSGNPQLVKQDISGAGSISKE